MSDMTRLRRFFLALALLVMAGSAAAETVYLRARLITPGQAPTDATGPDGAALFTLDTVSGALSWTLTYRKLPSTPPSEPTAAASGRSGSISLGGGASPVTGSTTLDPTQVSDMTAGLWHVDVDSFASPVDYRLAGLITLIDYVEYGASTGVSLQGFSSPGISGTVTLDLATLQMSWNIGWSVYFNHFGSIYLGGPAKGSEAASSIFPLPQTRPSSGTATLTPAQAAEMANGFWFFVVYDNSDPYRAYILPRYPRVVNISTRLEVGSGDNVAIVGFVISGITRKWVSLSAAGPSLANYGVSNFLKDPKLTLMRGNTVIATVDGYDLSCTYTCHTVANDASEPNVLVHLDPGPYTVIVESADTRGSPGVALVEVYELGERQTPLINISTRGQARQGGSAMIAGFVIEGTEPKTVIVRGIGPSLSNYGVAGALSNPTLKLVRMSDNAVIATSDDWQGDGNAAAITASGFAPSHALESAILMQLPPGAYSAIVEGKNGAIGVGMVEVYAVGNK